MRPRSVQIHLALAIVLTPFLHAADNSQELRNRLKSGAELSALDSHDIQPWHWKLDLTVFDKDGKNPTDGSLEMWFSGGNMLTVSSLGTDQMTVLRTGDTLYRTDGNANALASADFIQMQLLHPVPDEVYQPATTYKLSQEKAGQEKIDCIAPTLLKNTSSVVDIGRQFSFCFERNTPRLLMTYEPGDFSVLRSQLETFQSHEVPVSLEIHQGTIKLAEAKTVTLETATLAPSMFEVKPELKPFTDGLELKSSDLRGLPLSKNPPSYPVEAKQRNASGSVIFDAVIGKDGHIVSLQLASKSDPALVDAANYAISRWIYRPYLINGLPVEVKTQITLKFDMN
jgi:hypothetical protein